MNLTPVQSSNVAAIGADGDDLVVQFHSGMYRYKGAGSNLQDALESESVGRFVNAELRGQFEAERIEPDVDDLPIG